MRTRRHMCACCAEPFYRRNLLVLWDVTNPGHRDGWHQTQLRVCTKCLAQPKVRSLVFAIMGVIGQVRELKLVINQKKDALRLRGRRYAVQKAS
jgi:hypothetical protein